MTEAPLGPIFASRPHPSFKYPEFSAVPISGTDATEAFKRLVLGKDQSTAHIFPTYKDAIIGWLSFLGVSSALPIAVPRPCPAEFLKALEAGGYKPMFYPRDPDDFLGVNFNVAGAIMFSNPNRVDGFFYPQDIYEKLVTHVRTCSRKIPMFSDESIGLFSFNQVGPGKLRRKKLPGVYLGHTLYPSMAPQGPDLSWWIEPLEGLPDRAVRFPDLAILPQTLEVGYKTLSAFQSLQGASIQEFQRRMLLVAKNLRTFSDAIKPLLNAHKATIPVWPESGFNICLDISQEVLSRSKTVQEWAQDFWKNEKVMISSGEIFGAPELIQICYAAPAPVLLHIAAKLNENLAS